MSIYEAQKVDPSGRVQLIPVPLVSPGQCALCGKAEHPVGFATFGFNIDYFGTVIFCGDCVRDFAAPFDLIPSNELVEAYEKIAELNYKITTLEQNYHSLARDNADLLRLLRTPTVGSNSVVSINSVSPEHPIFASLEGNAQSSEANDSGFIDGQLEIDESESNGDGVTESERESTESSDEPRSDNSRESASEPDNFGFDF